MKIRIEGLIKPLKQAGYSKGKGELAGRTVSMDLEQLHVTYDGQTLDLKKIPGTKGGWRYFFACPSCGRRCRALYLRRTVPACGVCHDVYRQTLNRTKNCQHFFNMALKEVWKVDPTANLEKGYVDYGDFPRRPRGMKRTRYWRHFRRFMDYMDKAVALWLAGR